MPSRTTSSTPSPIVLFSMRMDYGFMFRFAPLGSGVMHLEYYYILFYLGQYYITTKKGARIDKLIGNKCFYYCPAVSLTPSRGVAKTTLRIASWHPSNDLYQTRDTFHVSQFPGFSSPIFSVFLFSSFLFVFWLIGKEKTARNQSTDNF